MLGTGLSFYKLQPLIPLSDPKVKVIDTAFILKPLFMNMLIEYGSLVLYSVNQLPPAQRK